METHPTLTALLRERAEIIKNQAALTNQKQTFAAVKSTLPTVDQALAKLAADPKAAAEFDAAWKNEGLATNRRDAVQVLIAQGAKLRQPMPESDRAAAAEKCKQQGLAHSQALREWQAKNPGKSLGEWNQELLRRKSAAKPIPAPVAIKPTASRPTPAPTPAPVSSSPLADKFVTLKGAEQTKFYKENSRALRLESLRNTYPTAIIPEA